MTRKPKLPRKFHFLSRTSWHSWVIPCFGKHQQGDFKPNKSTQTGDIFHSINLNSLSVNQQRIQLWNFPFLVRLIHTKQSSSKLTKKHTSIIRTLEPKASKLTQKKNHKLLELDASKNQGRYGSHWGNNRDPIQRLRGDHLHHAYNVAPPPPNFLNTHTKSW